MRNLVKISLVAAPLALAACYLPPGGLPGTTTTTSTTTTAPTAPAKITAVFQGDGPVQGTFFRGTTHGYDQACSSNPCSYVVSADVLPDTAGFFTSNSSPFALTCTPGGSPVPLDYGGEDNPIYTAGCSYELTAGDDETVTVTYPTT
jgi:hypothetical protein